MAARKVVVVVVVVIYHSHTATEAYPSRPMQFASKRNAQYVVISTRDPPKCELRSCRIVDDWVAEEPVRVAMGCHNSIDACGSPHEYCLAGHSAIPASCVRSMEARTGPKRQGATLVVVIEDLVPRIKRPGFRSYVDARAGTG